LKQKHVKLKAVRREKKYKTCFFPRERPRNNKNINKPYQGHAKASVGGLVGGRVGRGVVLTVVRTVTGGSGLLVGGR